MASGTAAMSALYPAPAKLNLFLHVTGRRADGYHLLQTAFTLLDFGDNLSFEICENGEIARVNPIAGLDPEQDLCVRAARLLQKTSNCRLGARITLDKKIPLGGGLGGGSSDAATTLLALNRLWKLDMGRQSLQDLALQLGADVPIFVFGRSAFAQGVGEDLQPISLDKQWYVVLTPSVHVPTAEVFASSELTRNTISIKIADFSMGYGHNDLEPVVCARFPVVAQYLNWLKQYGDARMTGSGACVFAAFATEEQAQQILAALPAGMQGFIASSLGEHPLRNYALN